MIRKLTALAGIIVLISCSSGKNAFKRGDYYEAVLTAVNRLRQNPDHKKSREVLNLSYQAAVSYLETDIQNQQNANANFKWRNAVQNYEKINNLYEQIRTSPGALKVVPNPVSRFTELTAAKQKAAEEVYEAGIQAMLKNTRQDAQQAYFLFQESERYFPGYREAIELLNQAEYNGTLRVAFSETNASFENFSLQPAVTRVQRQFLKFYSADEALNTKDQIEQDLKIVYRGCEVPDRPRTSSKTEEIEKEVKTGEKDVNGKKEPVMEKVKAKLTTYTRTFSANCSAFLEVTEVASGTKLLNNPVFGSSDWSYSWATVTGDSRALSSSQRDLTKRKEANPPRNEIADNARENLASNVTSQLQSFFRRY